MEYKYTRIDNGTGMLWTCEVEPREWSAGLIRGDDPTDFATPLLLLQMATASSLSYIIKFLLQPFGDFHFIPQLLSGILLGPSVLGRSKYYSSKLFNRRSLYLMDSYEPICILFMAFLASAQIDIGMAKRGGKLAIINGLMLYLFPAALGIGFCHLVLDEFNGMTPELRQVIHSLPSAESCLFFQMVYKVLSERKMLNSDLGRLALGTAMVCNCFGYAALVVVTSLKSSLKAHKFGVMVTSQASTIVLLLVIIFICRPIMKWMVKRTPEGQKLNNSYVCTICLMLLFCALLAETVGLSFFVGAIALGLATPSQSPLGSSLSERLGCFIQGILMPCYIVSIGNQVDISSVSYADVMIMELLIIVIQMAKFLAVVLPSVYFKVPVSQAITLGFIVNIQGIYDIQIFQQSVKAREISRQVYSIMVVLVIFHSIIHTIIVRQLSSRTNKYVAYRRRTVQHLRQESRLSVLAGFHKIEPVPSLLSILQLFCPTKLSPVSLFALNLKELEYQSVPVVVHHRLDQIVSQLPNRRSRIVNAFRSFEDQNQGVVIVECFTALAPLETMHDDVISLALDKETELLILTLDSEDTTPIRRMCRNVLENAPCSIGLLFDRGGLPDFRTLLEKHVEVNISVLFLGGADDREALVIALRMADHPSVKLQVLRLVKGTDLTPFYNLIEKKLDQAAIVEFRRRSEEKDNVRFREVWIEEAVELMAVLRENIEGSDLIIVGIKHDRDSPLLQGLWDWSEKRELGVIGDLLASQDLGMAMSVLIVQQHALAVETVVADPL